MGFQVVFIELLLTKTIRQGKTPHHHCEKHLLHVKTFVLITITRKGETKHPGRHMVALLALMNLGLWPFQLPRVIILIESL